MHTIKPIDRDVILKNKNFKLHVCVEEHNTIGGLASAISEVKCQEGIFVKQVNLGVNDEYTKSGSYDYMLDYYNLSPEKIVQTILKKNSIMTNIEKYRLSFKESLSIKDNDISENLEYNGIPEWDSIGHMTLMSKLEEEFDISLETDDIVDFSSFKKGIEILKKYKVNI